MQSCKSYQILCSRTGEGCIAYEETIANVKEEFEPLKDRCRSRKWTDEVAWRLELGLLTRCPSNRKRRELKTIVEQELGAEAKFFRDGEHLGTDHTLPIADD